MIVWIHFVSVIEERPRFLPICGLHGGHHKKTGRHTSADDGNQSSIGAGFGNSPNRGNEDPDERDVGVTVCPSLIANLNKSNHWHKSAKEPQPSDDHEWIAAGPKQRAHSNAGY